MQRPATEDGLFHPGNPLTGTKGTGIPTGWLNALLAIGALHHGAANPPGVEIGDDGDHYLNAAEKLLWGPKDAGAWPAAVNLKADGLYKTYTTLSAANADLANIPADTGLIWVNADPTPANCGYWVKTAGVLVQSEEGGFLALKTATEAATAEALGIAAQAEVYAENAAGAVTALLAAADPFPQYNQPGENGFLQLRLYPDALTAAGVGFYQPFMIVSVISAVLTNPVGGFGLLGANMEVTFDAALDPTTVSNNGNGTGSFEIYDLTADAYLAGELSTADNIVWTFNPTVDLIDNHIIQIRIAQTVATPAPERGYNGTIFSFIAVVELAPVTPIPTGVAATNGILENTIEWDVVLAITYDIYYTSNGATPTKASTKLVGVTSPYVHEALTGGTLYKYAVVATNSGIESDVSAIVSATPIPLWYFTRTKDAGSAAFSAAHTQSMTGDLWDTTIVAAENLKNYNSYAVANTPIDLSDVVNTVTITAVGPFRETTTALGSYLGFGFSTEPLASNADEGLLGSHPMLWSEMAGDGGHRHLYGLVGTLSAPVEMALAAGDVTAVITMTRNGANWDVVFTIGAYSVTMSNKTIALIDSKIYLARWADNFITAANLVTHITSMSVVKS